MKAKIYFTLILMLINAPSLLAIDFFFDYAMFQRVGEKPYIETYLSIPQNTLAIDSISQTGAVEIVISLSQETEIKYIDKLRLESQVLDPLQRNLNLLNTQRIILEAGIYLCEISIKDLNTKEEPKKYAEQINITNENTQLGLSDIQLVELVEEAKEKNNFTKNGFQFTPFVFPYYTKKLNNLKFYGEAYNTQLLESEKFLIQYYVTRKDKERVVLNLKRFKKETVKPVTAFIGSLNIESLPSGNYDLVVELRDHKNQVLSSKRKPFYRNNPQTELAFEEKDLEEMDLDITNTFVSDLSIPELIYFVGALEPNLNESQLNFTNNLCELKDEKNLKRFLYNFWLVNEPLEPAAGFTAYKEVLDFLDNEYGTLHQKGFETDRGYAYLKYGKPNHVVAKANFDPSALPYEIWQYYKIENGQTNVKFVFVNDDMGTNDFELIHSDARGEISDPNWEAYIYRKTGGAGARFGSKTSDF